MLSLALATVFLGGAPLDLTGSQSVDKVRQQIRAFGDRSELRLQGLNSESPYGTLPTVWAVKISGKSLTYEAYVESKTGKIRFISSNGGLHGRPDEKGVGLAAPEVARRAGALLQASGERRPTGKPYTQLNQGGQVMFWYPLLVNGYRFFGGVYSDQFWFMGRSGTFVEYRAAADPPPVNAASPRIDEKAALAKVRVLMEKERKSAASQGYGEVVYGTPAFDLGYYVSAQESTGRLVWRATALSELRNGFGSRGWRGMFLIDAVTGDEVHFTVSPTP